MLGSACSHRLPEPYRRIYLYHIRKTGGTSLNHMFLALSVNDTRTSYDALVRGPVAVGGRIYVGFDKQLLSCPEYFYGFSHACHDRLALPAGTFTIVCFRDPVRRVIALYSQFRNYLDENVKHPCRIFSDNWVRNGFSRFLQEADPAFLYNQLRMFSRSGSVDEAVARASAVDFIFRTEMLDPACRVLGDILALPLVPLHMRQHSHRHEITEHERNMARSLLESEYRMLDQLLGEKGWQCTTSISKAK